MTRDSSELTVPAELVLLRWGLSCAPTKSFTPGFHRPQVAGGR